MGSSQPNQLGVIVDPLSLGPKSLTEADTKKSRSATANLKNRFLDKWFTSAARFRSKMGAIQKSGLSGTAYLDARDDLVGELETDWHEALRDGVLQGWALGYASRGHRAAGSLSVREIFKLSPSLMTQLKRYFEYASRFAHEYSDGIPDVPRRMPFGVRSEQYARALNGAYTQGAVDGGLPGERIIWVLGASERTCADCPVLAAISIEKPFTRETLPTTPGQGETECLHNCRCFLVFLRGQKETIENPELLRDILTPQDPPLGKRDPTEREGRIINDLNLRMNYARRMMAESDPKGPEFKRWSNLRQGINGKLIDITEPRNIAVSTVFTPPEVITGRHIAPDDVRSILEKGVDGRSAASVGINQMGPQLDKASRELERTLNSSSVPPAIPISPNTALLSIDFEESFDLSNDDQFGSKSIDPNIEFSPDPTGQWTVNICGLGLRETAEAHVGLLRLLVSTRFPYFIQVAPYGGDGWEKILFVTGTWVRGPAEEVHRFMVDAREQLGIKQTAYAPFLQGV